MSGFVVEVYNPVDDRHPSVWLTDGSTATATVNGTRRPGSASTVRDDKAQGCVGRPERAHDAI